MDVILYAEVNVICITVLTIIATKAMTFGYDQSLKINYLPSRYGLPWRPICLIFCGIRAPE